MQKDTTPNVERDASPFALECAASDVGHITRLMDIAHEIYIELDRRLMPPEDKQEWDRLSALLWIVRDLLTPMEDRFLEIADRYREVERGAVMVPSVARGDHECSVLNVMVQQYEQHRIAWENSESSEGDLKDDHPEAIAMDHVALSFAQFPIMTGDGMRAKAGALLRNSTLRGYILDNLNQDLRGYLLRSMAGLCQKGAC